MIALQSLTNPCNLVVLQQISFVTNTSIHFVLINNQTPIKYNKKTYNDIKLYKLPNSFHQNF
jgi:uncharacterized protein with WD repeat